MANSFPRQASPMTREAERPALTAGLALVATLLAAAPVALAEVPLSPYSAEYRTSKSGLKISTQRELKQEANGNFTLSNDGKNLVASLRERSVFGVQDGRIVPQFYVYQLSAPLMKRRREVRFTEGSDTIRSLYKEKWYELPYTEGTLDRMSQQEQLRLFLLNDPTPKENVSFRVADGKRIKEYEFVYRGEEIIETPLGPVNTLHFERTHDDPDRKSDTWIAPGWDYLMVRTVHVEEGSPVEAMITKASIDGVPVSPDA